MNQGLITFIDQSDQLLMLSKHICASTFDIDTFYTFFFLWRGFLDRVKIDPEVVEYEQYVRVKCGPPHSKFTASPLCCLRLVTHCKLSTYTESYNPLCLIVS